MYIRATISIASLHYKYPNIMFNFLIIIIVDDQNNRWRVLINEI